MKKLLLILLCAPLIGKGQCVGTVGCMDPIAVNYNSHATCPSFCLYGFQTYVPDDNFEQELINLGYDNILDDYVTTSNISSVAFLNLGNKNISDLTGIQDFTSLNSLWCYNNNLSVLDLSNNTNLTILYCNHNQLVSLNVGSNVLLQNLRCYNNNLTSLDLSNNSALVYLKAQSNNLSSLDIRNGNNTNITTFNGASNSNLLCIDVDDPVYFSANWSNNISSWTSFSSDCATALGCTDPTACNYNLTSTIDDGSCLLPDGCTDPIACNYNSSALCDDGSCILPDGCTDPMACNYNAIALCNDGSCILPDGCTDPNATNYNLNAQCDDGSCVYALTYVPDDNFEDYLEANNMGNGIANDDHVFTYNINTVTNLNLDNLSISDLTGIEDFTALTDLNCVSNQLTSLDLSNNTVLTHLECQSNQITSLNITNNTALTYLNYSSQNIWPLVLTVDFSQNIALEDLFCPSLITTLDLSNNIALEYLHCKSSALTTLDLSNNIALEYLYCRSSVSLTSLNINGLSNLQTLVAYHCNLTALDLSTNISLSTLSVFLNNLTSLDLSNNTALVSLICDRNQLTSLDVRNGNNTNIATFHIYDMFTQSNTNLLCIDVDDPVYSTSNWINVASWMSFSSDCATAFGCTDPTACNFNPNATIDDGTCSGVLGCMDPLASNYNTHATCPGFCTYCVYGCTNSAACNYDPLATCDDGSCGYVDGCMDITACNYNANATCDDGSCILPDGCTDVTACNYDNTALCDDGSCIMPDGCTDPNATNYNSTAQCDDGSCVYNLTYVPDDNFESYLESHGMGNGIANDDSVFTYNINTVTSLFSLFNLNISDLTGIEDFIALEALNCGSNQLTSLDLSNNTALTYLDCSGNQLALLDLNTNINLQTLRCYWNNITTLDLSQQSNLVGVSCGNNQLTSLNVKNGNNHNIWLTFFNISSNPNLLCVEVDDPVYSTTNWTDIDPWTSFSLDCATALGCTDPNATNYNSSATIDDGSCLYCSGPGPITGVNLTDIIHDRATFNWDDMNSTCAVVDQIRIRYRVGTNAWSTKTMGSPVGNNAPCLNTSKLILNLSASTTYEYDFKIWYQDGTVVSWHAGGTFTTTATCNNVTNITTTPITITKTEFCWSPPLTPYAFVRLKYRVDASGTFFNNIGGMGVFHPSYPNGSFCKNKNGLTPGTDYRVMWRTWCSPSGGPYRSPQWDGPVLWTQPTSIKVDELSTINSLEVYPNPSRDVFNVEFTSESKQSIEVRLVNLLGEIIFTENLEDFEGEYTHSFNLSEYSKGVYLLELDTDNGIVNKKLILQ